jgi:two-component system, NtrC family, sensor kinase
MLTDDDLVTLNRAATVARLLAGVAHEVNNALLVISGNVELLEDPPPSAEALAKGLNRIKTQSARAAAVIADVLTFARDSAQGWSRINLREIIGTAVSLRTYAVGRAGHRIELSIPDEPSLIVHGNRVLLLQAILNLITNAEQALAGGRGGLIRVDAHTTNGRVQIRVADTGPGVPADQRSRLFEPLVTTKARTESSGLGLAAARCIAEQHGGTVNLGAADSGAVFEVDLPMA